MRRRLRKVSARLTGRHHAFSASSSSSSVVKEEEPGVVVEIPVSSTKGSESEEEEKWTTLERGEWPGTFSDAPGSTFRVRQVGYPKTPKAASGEGFYRVVGVDILRANNRRDNLVENGIVRLPLGDNCSFPPRWLVVNAQLPDETGPVFSRPPPDADGKCHSIALICELTESGKKRLETSEPAARLFIDFLRAAPSEPREEPDFRGRFKVIVGVKDPKDLPAIARSYNYKPALITKSGSLNLFRDVMEMNVSVFRFGYSSRSGLSLLTARFAALVLDVAFLLEGRSDAELPECVLAAATLHNCGYDLARPMPPPRPVAAKKKKKKRKKKRKSPRPAGHSSPALVPPPPPPDPKPGLPDKPHGPLDALWAAVLPAACHARQPNP
ncbi:hypothetical protein CTAYLR_001717 [Chrysophaeum taylorii]|uniref:Protein ENHANCED DISEASE RESISTANCE 2 C-terminal domain-containing protein n=1 Tax=Chrysophaeum taylorii TaxID=2483200 RepID=A0AAD7U689_9STRA|nr:hypothetical protein CTAYLR_001717 [Chrysophaeum taylorii]